MSNLLCKLLSISIEQWPLTPGECNDAATFVYYFHRQPDGRVVALSMYPFEPYMCTYEQWEEENVSLLQPIISIYLEGLMNV